MIRRAVLCVAFLLVVSPALVASGTPSAPKVSQVHSNCYLGAVGIAVDASGVYVAGSINGTLPGQTSAGSCDAFLRKHRSEEHTSELQSQSNLVCRLLLEKKKNYPLILFR